MDARRAAHVLERISGLLELSGVEKFRARAYRGAAAALRALGSDDITPLYYSGELASVPGIGPATLSVLAELVETGESSYLNRLLETVPEGLLQVARVPGLTPAKVALLHTEIGIESLEDLEEAARDGRLRTVRGFGDKTVKHVLQGIEIVRGRGGRLLYREALIEAERSALQLAQQPDVKRVDAAGEIRRISDVVRDIALVAECDDDADAAAVLNEMERTPGVLEAERRGDAVHLRFVDDTEIDVSCAAPEAFPLALWRATGSAEHVAQVEEYAASCGLSINGGDNNEPVKSEHHLYERLGLQYIPPELREALGEVEAAARDALPNLIRADDIRGVLHCHSEHSDGSVPIAEMAAAARERGWDYLGISDHSMAAFYAGGLKPDDVMRQHDEIDRLNNDTPGFRILKGIECDILADGALDYDTSIRDSFEYIIGSIHSRFSMDLETMTARVLAAMDDPRLTILAHPTGRLLLQREPYALDLEAVIHKAAATGVTLELNADPARLDLEWRWCKKANDLGVRIAIGPDAHSPRGLDHTFFGVKLARKAWLTADNVLNTRSADEILTIARSRTT
ncbi:MAG: DNA polymerase/3'-5' exonuclease PolX [Gemmatimonadaceae bacterium]